MSILKYENIQWSVPLLFYDDEFSIAISDILDNLNVPNPIKYSYGMVRSKWSGGRVSNIRLEDKAVISNTLNKMLERGVTPAFTFTNNIINDEILNDEFANWLLDYGVANNCQFIVVSQDLFKYIKKRYPEAKCVSSVIQPMFRPDLMNDYEKELEFYNERLDEYDRVVLRPDFVKDHLLNCSDRVRDLSRVEILVNQTCARNCIGFCYKSISNSENVNKQNSEDKDRTICSAENYIKKNGQKKFIEQTIMVYEDEIRKFMEIGVVDFKLQGRHYSHEICRQLIIDNLFKDMGASYFVKNSMYAYADRLKMTEYLYTRDFWSKNAVTAFKNNFVNV